MSKRVKWWFGVILLCCVIAGMIPADAAADDWGLQRIDQGLYTGDPKTILVFVHGWNPHMIYIPGDIYWTNFVEEMRNYKNGYFRDKFGAVYQLVYDSGNLSTWDAGRFLISELEKVYPDLDLNYYIHLVVHSRGGLVSRAAMQLPTSKNLRFGRLVTQLFTISTPHHGSAVADAMAALDTIHNPKGSGYYDLIKDTYLLRTLLPNYGGSELVTDNADGNGPTYDDPLIKSIALMELYPYWSAGELTWIENQLDYSGNRNTIHDLNYNSAYYDDSKKITAFYTYLTNAADITPEEFAGRYQAYLDADSRRGDGITYDEYLAAAKAGLLVLAPMHAALCRYPSSDPSNQTVFPYTDNDGVVSMYSGSWPDNPNLRKRIPVAGRTHFEAMGNRSIIDATVLPEIQLVVDGYSPDLFIPYVDMAGVVESHHVPASGTALVDEYVGDPPALNGQEFTSGQGWIRPLGMGDADGDSDRDAFVVDGDGNVYVLLTPKIGRDVAWRYIGNPKKAWGWALSSQSTWDKPLGVGDVNGDGRADVVVVNGNGDIRAMLTPAPGGAISSWYIGNPKKKWNWALSSQSTWDKPLGVGDIDGDRHADVVVVNGSGDINAMTSPLASGGAIGHWYIGNPKKLFGWALTSQQGWDKPVAVGDANHDGSADVIIVNRDGHFHAVLSSPVSGACQALRIENSEGGTVLHSGQSAYRPLGAPFGWGWWGW